MIAADAPRDSPFMPYTSLILPDGVGLGVARTVAVDRPMVTPPRVWFDQPWVSL